MRTIYILKELISQLSQKYLTFQETKLTIALPYANLKFHLALKTWKKNYESCRLNTLQDMKNSVELQNTMQNYFSYNSSKFAAYN